MRGEPKRKALQRRYDLLRGGFLSAVVLASFGACERESNSGQQPQVEVNELRAQRANTPTPEREDPNAAVGTAVRAPSEPEQLERGAPGQLNPPGARAPTPGEKPSEQMLTQFARAYHKVESLNQSYAQRLSAAPDPAQARAIQQEASEAMLTVVRDVGLSPTEYTQIARYLETTPEVRRQVLEPAED